MKILVVEDESIPRLFLKEYIPKFLRNDVEILEAEDGEKALELFKEHKDSIELIVTDMKMPIMNGYDFIKEIRKIDDKVPILIESAFYDSNELNEQLIDGIVRKPISPSMLKSNLNKLFFRT